MKLLNSPIQKLCSRGTFSDSSVKSNQGTDSSADYIFTDKISDYFTDLDLERMLSITHADLRGCFRSLGRSSIYCLCYLSYILVCSDKGFRY